jgi:DNA-binding transcriptional MocR family regulator
MTDTATSSTPDLMRRRDAVRRDYEAFKARGLRLDMTRGKPSPDQLDLADGLMTIVDATAFEAAAGDDTRNYGGQQGLPELRALFSSVLGAPAERIVAADNSSLALMHDCIAWAMLKGLPEGAKPWSLEESPAFICPVPGYDRHFAICEEYNIRMLPVAMNEHGPDMESVERLVLDPAVKGMWCVPKYSNPSGEIYSPETAKRLASMKTGAGDFRLFWDNAYDVHHLTETRHQIANILDLCESAGNPDRAFVFASTSKITLAGAGVAFFASSAANVAWYLARASKRTIGPDKINHLRHVRFLKDEAGIARHMDAHRALIAPKFAAVLKALDERLAGTNVARWSRPQGGYFISVDVMDGTATRVVALAKEAGVALTPAGATWPGNHDPNDRSLRLAPTFPSLRDVEAASEGIAICIQLAALEKLEA